MKRYLASWIFIAAFSPAASDVGTAEGAEKRPFETEDYVKEPMPPGFRVIVAEFEGPVFVDSRGKTLYTWPMNAVRNGYLGDSKDAPSCDNTVYRVNTGLQSPYPGGLELPEADTRQSCLQIWPPVLASEGVKPIGKWTVIVRPDGIRQWAYNGYALYTSLLDSKMGDVNGGTKLIAQRAYAASDEDGRSTGVVRIPAAPPSNVPPQFTVAQKDGGRLLVLTSTHSSVYVSDNDTSKTSNCDANCRLQFQPIPAPEHAVEQGHWKTIENSPGVRQWTFRGKPLYTRLTDPIPHSLDGGDIPGWHNVWVQRAPPPPKGFTVNANRMGTVLGDEKGRTLYVYRCNDDAHDQQDCSHPSQPQAYRLAVSGKGSQQRAMQNFPYVTADAKAKSESKIWTIIWIDPSTGRKTDSSQPNALRVWAWRDRPVYLCSLDRKPGDIECDGWGENFGLRNGYRAFWVRDAFGGYYS